ncbi:MAG: VWA domain-containing protein [Sandaracinus sp.]|nr:VWA domain-containing protein [Myxococcales bacterium]MCB9598969.1 VWA domain-containing protein [Sandaracinus sp.]MCB9619781.1 VWA domain-containing protein [Sandaracinus sp.]
MPRLLALVLLTSLACSPDGGSGRGPGRDAGMSTTDGAVPPRPDTGPLPDTGPIGTCDAINVSAEEVLAPVDIVWIVDDSGSMSEEASLVQEQMNSFVTTISASGIDVHVVLITAPGFINVPDPLGSNPDQFLRVEESVFSDEALEKLISTYPRWSDFLRRESSLHLIAVTDDESKITGAEFVGDMQAAAGRTFRLHAIASPPGSTHTIGGIGFTMDGCAGPHGEAAANGERYWQASLATGGRQLNICSSDWSSLFRELATAVSIPTVLPCVYDIPEPPMGETFAPNLVNMEFTPGDGTPPRIVPNVGSYDRCGDPGGWYYEGDPADPDRIVVCPATCAQFEAAPAANVEIALGCATVLI